MPTWRNGRRAAFRSQSLHGGVGSNPIVGTIFILDFPLKPPQKTILYLKNRTYKLYYSIGCEEYMKQIITKKKHFYMMQAVKDFMRGQSGDIKQELNNIVWRLETEGALVMPYGEKNQR